MPTLLHIDSSPRSASVSSKLAATFVARWKQQNPGGVVVHHNTTLEKLPYIDEAMLGGFFTPAEALSDEQKQQIALSNQLVDELLAADVLVFGVPMWNLGIPASLKAWVDLIVRAGRTFNYTATGVAPLVPAGKKVYVFTARGGSYTPGTPAQAWDLQEPYLRALLGFLGLSDVTFIHAEDQSRAPETASAGLLKAEAQLAALAC
jgi:FMN-dependent NADH-azoreductase